MHRESNKETHGAPRPRCPRCCRALAACFCARLQIVHNDCPVLILQDAVEARHALGTAVIATLSLSHCKLVRVQADDYVDVEGALDQLLTMQPVLVYPGADACPVTELGTSQPLLFIDATWRRSRRLLLGHTRLAALPRAALVNPPQSRYRLRKSRRPDDLSTVEAIAYTLGALEHSPGKYLPLLRTMDSMIQQQINCMGDAVYLENYGRK